MHYPCMQCGGKTHVEETRKQDNIIVRYRKCLVPSCGKRFRTEEILVLSKKLLGSIKKYNAAQQGVQPTVATVAQPEVESKTRNSG